MANKKNNGKVKEQKSSFLRYRDPTGELSSKELAVGTWYIRHKLQFRKTITGILIFWCVVSISFSLIMWGAYFFIGFWQDRNMAVELTNTFKNYEDLQTIYAARDVKVTNVQVLKSGDNVYDFVAQVRNTNQYWVAKVKYVFNFGGGETEVSEMIILPGGDHALGAFGVESTGFPTNAQFRIESTEWTRIDPHEVGDPAQFILGRHQFSYDNVVFSRAERTEEGIPVNRLEFDIFNDSAYSFWQPMFLVELFNGSQRIGVIPLTVERLEAGIEQHIDIRTFIETTSISDINLVPLVNVFDEDVYIFPGE